MSISSSASPFIANVPYNYIFWPNEAENSEAVSDSDTESLADSQSTTDSQNDVLYESENDRVTDSESEDEVDFTDFFRRLKFDPED